MARSLRIEVEDGWHHITARGNERRVIFRDDVDRSRFLELLSAVVERFGIVLAAYVLMDNHYHLVLRTPLANLSRAVQWLNVCYGSGFNRRHRRCGHLFQGRFKSLLVDADEWLGELTRYVHLNPVRTRRMGLQKSQRRDAEQDGKNASPALVRERLRVLRSFRWSSYRAYAGYTCAPEWLNTGDVLGRLGRGSVKSRQGWYRDHVERAVRQGMERHPWEHVRERAVLGAIGFIERIRESVRAMRGEPHRIRGVSTVRPGIEQVRRAVEQAKGGRWVQFAQRHGDNGRDVFLWLARRHCGLTLEQLGAAADGMSGSAASEAVRRTQDRMRTDKRLASTILASGKILKMEI